MAGLSDILHAVALALGLQKQGPRRDPTGPSKRRPRRGGVADPMPVEPDRPNNLTGGAAAALEFDD